MKNLQNSCSFNFVFKCIKWLNWLVGKYVLGLCFRVERQVFRSILGKMQTTAYIESQIALDFFSKYCVNKYGGCPFEISVVQICCFSGYGKNTMLGYMVRLFNPFYWVDVCKTHNNHNGWIITMNYRKRQKTQNKVTKGQQWSIMLYLVCWVT